MRTRARVNALRKIAQLRDLQRVAAEMEAARASARLHGLDADRDECLAVLGTDEKSWAAQLTGATINVGMALAWSDAVRNREGDIHRMNQEIWSAESDRSDRIAELQRAVAQADVAGQLASKARRDMARKHEEAVLNDLGDRMTWRSAGS